MFVWCELLSRLLGGLVVNLLLVMVVHDVGAAGFAGWFGICGVLCLWVVADLLVVC